MGKSEYYAAFGLSKSIQEWKVWMLEEKHIDIKLSTLRARLAQWVSVEEAVTTPVMVAVDANTRRGKRIEFRGRTFTVQQIADETGVSRASLDSLLRKYGLEEFESRVTKLQEKTAAQRRREQSEKYLYKEELLTVAEITQAENSYMTRQNLRSRIRYWKIKPGEPVDDLIKRLKEQRENKLAEERVTSKTKTKRDIWHFDPEKQRLKQEANLKRMTAKLKKHTLDKVLPTHPDVLTDIGKREKFLREYVTNHPYKVLCTVHDFELPSHSFCQICKENGWEGSCRNWEVLS